MSQGFFLKLKFYARKLHVNVYLNTQPWHIFYQSLTMFNYDNQMIMQQSWAHCDVTQLITAKTVERQVTLSEVRNFNSINPTNLVFFLSKLCFQWSDEYFNKTQFFDWRYLSTIINECNSSYTNCELIFICKSIYREMSLD